MIGSAKFPQGVIGDIRLCKHSLRSRDNGMTVAAWRHVPCVKSFFFSQTKIRVIDVSNHIKLIIIFKIIISIIVNIVFIYK